MGPASRYGSQFRRRPTETVPSSTLEESTVAGSAVRAPDEPIMRRGRTSSGEPTCQAFELHLCGAHRVFDGHVVHQAVLEVSDDDLTKLLVVVDEIAQKNG